MVSVSLRALNFCGLISSCQDLHFFAWFLCLGSALLLLCKEQVGNVQKTLPIPTSFQPMTKETGVQILPFFALGETILSFFLFFFSWCGPFLKFFIEFVKILLLFYVLVYWSWAMWDLGFPTRDQTHTSCIGRWSLNHRTTREVPKQQV